MRGFSLPFFATLCREGVSIYGPKVVSLYLEVPFRSVQTATSDFAWHSCNHLGAIYWIFLPQESNQRKQLTDLRILPLLVIVAAACGKGYLLCRGFGRFPYELPLSLLLTQELIHYQWAVFSADRDRKLFQNQSPKTGEVTFVVGIMFALS
jgi:hypothetical protein